MMLKPREVLCFAGFFMLAGCGGVAVPALVGATAATQVPGWVSTAQIVITGVKELSQLAQDMCWLQASANASGDAELSRIAGYGCVW